MREGGSDDRVLGAAEGPPSARSRSELRDDLRREVAEARVRFEEASLRLEAHRLLGNEGAADDVLAEQQQVLADLEARLGRVVSAAVLQRDAEEVLAGMAPVGPPEPVPSVEQQDPPPRRRPALSGVASAVAVLGVAALAVVGIADPPSEVEVLGAADPAESATGDESTDAPSQRPLPAESGPTAGRSPSGLVDEQDTSAEGGDSEETTDRTDEGPAGPSPDESDEPTDDPTSGFDALVDGISDALRELGGGDTDTDISDPPDDGSSEGSSTVERIVEELEEGSRRSASTSEADDEADEEEPSVEPSRDGFVSD